MSQHVPPRVDHWPAAVISSAIRQGTLVRCGPGYRPVTWPESPLVRCTAIAWALTPKYAACNHTAAWIWGGSRAPGTVIEISVRTGRVPYRQQPGTTQHEYVLSEGDVVNVGDYWVTSPVRTVFDLLRSTREFTVADMAACRLLLAHHSAGAELLAARARTTSPAGSKRILERLARIYAVNRYTS